jgi:hypothetical protein
MPPCLLFAHIEEQLLKMEHISDTGVDIAGLVTGCVVDANGNGSGLDMSAPPSRKAYPAEAEFEVQGRGKDPTGTLSAPFFPSSLTGYGSTGARYRIFPGCLAHG